MFTIRQHLGITRSEVKWESPVAAPTLAPTPGNEDINSLLIQAKAKLDESAKITDSYVRYRQVHGDWFLRDSVKALLEKIVQKNAEKRKDIQKMISEARATTEWSGDENQEILKKLEKSFADEVQAVNAVKVSNIAAVRNIAATGLLELSAEDGNARTSVTNKTEFQDIAIKIEKEHGKIKKDSMVALLADFDGASGVEKDNRSILRQAIFGGGKQKEVIGERQVYELLSRMTNQQLDAVYIRITGDTSGLPWDAKVYREGTGSWRDLALQDQAKINRFQRELADQTSMMADLTEAFIGKGARTGLRAVLEGSTEELRAAIANPNNQAKYLKMISDSKVLERDPSFLTKTIAFLLKIGIQIPITILSKGLIGGYIESQEVTAKGITGGLTLDKRVGQSGNLSASLDLLGVRLGADWNNPTARIVGITQGFMEVVGHKESNTEKIGEALGKVTTTVMKDFPAPSQTGTDEKSEKRLLMVNEMNILTEGYKKRVNEIASDTKLKPDNKQEIIANLTLMYLSRAEAAKGTQLEGVFAAFNTAGWMVGLSGGKVEMSATFGSTREGSAAVEADALQKKVIAGNELETWLSKAGIKKAEDNAYILPQDGDKPAQKITIPAGKDINWEIVEHVYDDGVRVTASYTLVTIVESKERIPGNEKVDHRPGVPAKKGSTLTIKRENSVLPDIGDAQYRTEVSTLIHALRQDPRQAENMIQLNTFITQQNFSQAETLLKTILESKPKDFTAIKLLRQINESNDKPSILKNLIGLSSGGSESISMGKRIEAGESLAVDIYYEKYGLNKEFASLFGITENDVRNIINNFGSLKKSQIITLGQVVTGGFTGLTAYAQKNGNQMFKALDKITNSNARIIGDTMPIVLLDQITNLQNKFSDSLSPQDLLEYRKNLPKDVNMGDQELKDFLVKGELPKSLTDKGYSVPLKPQIYAYLSFVEGAQCFNLGFALSSPTIKEPDVNKVEEIKAQDATLEVPATKGVRGISRTGTGTVVGTPSIHHLQGGVGLGTQWGSHTDSQSSTPGVAGGTADVRPGSTVTPAVPVNGGGRS